MNNSTLCKLLLIFTTSALFSSAKNETVYLASFPRSGNTWMRYYLEYLTKRPSGKANLINKRAVGHNGALSFVFDLKVDFDKPYILKIHSGKGLNELNGYLILLIRNYKEVVVRHSKGKELQVHEETFASSLQGYVDLIHLFESWPEDKRFLVYYEDLIENPHDVFYKLTAFMEEGEERIGPFMENLEKHRQNAIDFYNQVAAGSQSEGKSALFHSEVLTKEQKEAMDTFIIANASPSFQERYLQRYLN